MKIDLFNIEEFIKINKLKEITNPILFEHGIVPSEGGLISNEIFGISPKDRKETFAYIDLYNHYFHPHIYKQLLQIYRKLEKIINGSLFVSIDSQGMIVDDENGETGIKFLYDNWEKIKWPDRDSIKTGDIIKMIRGRSKNEIFQRYEIVIPAFYRDIRTKGSGGNVTDDINTMYAKLIRYTGVAKNQGMFSFQSYNNDFQIQSTLLDIYNYFSERLKGKGGVLRRYLMGKTVDYCTRTIITAASYQSERPEDLEVTFEYTSVPISQACVLLYPFVSKYVHDFFQRELSDNRLTQLVYDTKTGKAVEAIEINDPSQYYHDKYIKKMIDQFKSDPSSRFRKISVKGVNGKSYYLHFTGIKCLSDGRQLEELSNTINRPMTWTDLLFMACVDASNGKHLITTRYPVLDEYGTFCTKIRISSTIETEPMMVNGIFYPRYPKIDFDIPHESIGIKFIDSVRFSNSYLKGIDGDYDGDQTTCKILFSQEANEELEKYMYSKQNIIDSYGSNIRVIGKECTQSFYVLTKEPDSKSRKISDSDKEYLLSVKPEDITFSWFVANFGNVTSKSNNNEIAKTSISKFKTNDVIHLSPSDYSLVKSELDTTIGRLIFNKVMVEKLGFSSYIDYLNKPLTNSNFKKFEASCTNLLLNDIITTKQFMKYIDTRDWFGLQIHGVITTSFTMKVIKTPKEVKDLKAKLLKENKKALEEGDYRVSSKIEEALIKKEQEVLNDDIGMDLYKSGARGSVGNNLKNINLMRGAIYNPYRGDYEVITNSLLDGLNKNDIAPHANTIVQGAFPKAIGLRSSGYLSKQLLASMQMEKLGPKDSDCGSTKYIETKLTLESKKDKIYRYIQDGSNLVLLDDSNYAKYVGKTVKMRSPMYCKGLKGNQHLICNKCAGELYYKTGKEYLGLLVSVCTQTLSNADLQKFHDSTIHVKEIDVDDMLI